MSEEKQNSTPPYLSYVTFKNTIQSLALDGKLPRQIDRTILGTMSGAGQKQFIAALRFFDLIDEDGTPQKNLNGLAKATESDWKDFMGVLLKEYYPREVEQLDNASPKTLRESFVNSFDGIGPSLIEPGIRFLVSAAKECGLPVSGHIGKRNPRAANPPKRKPKKDIRQAFDVAVGDVGQQNVVASSIQNALLNKFPNFDPTWAPEQQKVWFDAYSKLLEMHGKEENP